MADEPLDRIHIRELRLRCILGLRDWERRKKQEIAIDLTLHADLRAACRSDAIGDTVDYSTLKQRVIDLVEASQFQLVERLAQAVADLCLEEARVRRAEVTIDKAGALRFARSVAVSITRERPGGA